MNVKITSAQKIGEKMCLIEKEKINILKNKNTLRHLREKNFIELDLTNKKQEIQKIIREKAKEEKYKDKQTKVGYKKLIVKMV